jgi:hypothetical protein
VEPVAALVHVRPKPKGAWQRADFQYRDDQLDEPKDSRKPPSEPWLVGRWSADLQLDPDVWGLPDRQGRALGVAGSKAVPLTLLTVRDARRHLAHAKALLAAANTTRLDGLATIGAIVPAAWDRSDPAGPGPSDLSACTEATLRHMGVAGHDELCLRAIRDARDAPTPAETDVPPAWFRPPGEPAAPRRPPRDRNAGSPEDHTTALPAGFKASWRRLTDATIFRPSVITAWRLLHNCLGTAAFLSRVRLKMVHPLDAPSRHGLVAAACCSAPPCAALADPPAETVAHAFLECPEARPAVEWLAAAWAALSGGAPPPLTPAVIIADDHRTWPGAPAGERANAAWTRLRVATLGAIWRVRCARHEAAAQHASLARTAVVMAVDSVQSAIRRDWQRTQVDITALDDGSFCADFWRGFDARKSVEWFREEWATPAILCALEGPAQAVSLRMRLQGDVVVPLPE